MRAVGALTLAAFVGTIWAANYAVRHWESVPVGFGLHAPAGVYFAGLAFTLRDVTQRLLGRHAVVGAILLGAALSWHLGGQLAKASALAFLVSEAADFAVYTPLARRNWAGALALSNFVGLILDSYLFLTIAFGSTALLLGQIVGKSWATFAAVLVLLSAPRMRRALA